MQRRAQGFTLFELMVVVTVVALIAAFAIPSLLGSLKGGKEASTISALKTIASVSEQYSIRFGGYADSLNRLTTTGYLDSLLGTGTRSGYTYEYSATRYSWECSAGAETPGVTGDKYFYTNQNGVIYASLSGPATSADPPLD